MKTSILDLDIKDVGTWFYVTSLGYKHNNNVHEMLSYLQIKTDHGRLRCA